MRATLPNPELRLRAGQAVVVALRGAVLKNALAVPQRAVIESPQGKAVWVAVDKDGKTLPESRPIEVGEWVDLPGDGPQAHAWVVKKGLAAGDRVIVDNLVRLSMLPPGSPIQVDAAAPAAADNGGKGN
jgi:membrane fusion protein (multidrug efflux system)